MAAIDLEKLFRSVSIENVAVSLGMELRPESPTKFMALCPFHKDKNPSLLIDSSRERGLQHFHCFACGEHGDVIDLVKQRLGLDFLSAANWLANTSGISIAARGQPHKRSDPTPLGSGFQIGLELYERSGDADKLNAWAETRGHQVGSLVKAGFVFAKRGALTRALSAIHDSSERRESAGYLTDVNLIRKAIPGLEDSIHLQLVREGGAIYIDFFRGDLKELTAAGALPAKDAKVSLTTLRRRVAEVDVNQRIASREGDARARMVCRTSVTGAAASYPLQRVELDHTPLNWVAICDRTGLPLGRPLLTLAIDAFSGYGLGMYLSFYGPGVTSVSGVIRNAIEPKGELPPGFNLENRWLSYGVADEYVLDNGLEFHAAAFKRMCWSLGSDMTYCRVRTPWLKPHVERFFAGLDHLTLAKGRVTKPVANVLRIDPYKDACITFSDLVRGLTKFIVDVHPFQVNERKLARPYDLFLEGIERCPPAAYPHDPKSLRLTSGLSNVQTVDHGGVNLLGIPYGGRELLDLRKRVGKPLRTMCRWDPDDLDTIQVQDPHNPTRWHSADTLWPDYARGLSWNQHRLIRKFKREELSASGAEEQLMAARLQLHDMWKDVTRPGKRADSLMAARAAGFTSSRVFAGVEAAEPDCRVLVTPSAAPSEADAIPEFDSFDLEAA